MIKLIPYKEEYEAITIKRIIDFFSYHASLVGKIEGISDEDYQEAKETLDKWLQKLSIYMIFNQEENIGFLTIGYRGSEVAWIEDIYVDKEHRSKGVGSKAIHCAEEIVKARGYEAICVDVTLRNLKAIKLYYELGFNALSLMTLRKELKENNPRDKEIDLFGYTFKV